MSESDEAQDTGNSAPTYGCKRCEKTFSSKRDQLLHKREVHMPSKSTYQCKICSKFFCSSGNLDRHMKVHQDIRPHVCGICEKGFAQAVNLQRHYSVHNGERPFQCSFCTKAFTQLSNMQRHQLTHTGEKPFRCKRCGRYFSQRVNLKKHIMGHLDIKPFECKYCGESFVQITILRRHLQQHIKNGMAIDIDAAIKLANQEAKQTLDVAQPVAFECAVCRNVFEDFSKFELHEAECDGVNDNRNEQNEAASVLIVEENMQQLGAGYMSEFDTHEIVVKTSP